MTSQPRPVGGVTAEERKARIAEAAQRALAEAAERRKLLDESASAAPMEKGGQAGPDPARYGDWEKDGVVSDF